ncbi:hypothetical protein [Enterobacter cloacae]|uniref:hypothetical protein n=1 Tax=Enterobacter cloacae TaxID=550 RepID=UPI0031D48957
MTVSTVVDHNDYTGNGVTTSFPYTFRIFKKTDLTVSVVDLSENITVLVLDTDYTVTNAGGYNGGNVVLTAPLATGWQISIARELEPTQETDLRNQGKFFAEVHEDAFDKLTMLIQQAYSMFRLALRKPSSVANWYDALNNYIRNVRDPSQPQDAATKHYVDSLISDNTAGWQAGDAALDQKINANFSKTLRVPEVFINQIPAASQRANKLLAFDSNGNVIAVLPESGSASDVLLELANDGDKKIGSTYGGTVYSDYRPYKYKKVGYFTTGYVIKNSEQALYYSATGHWYSFTGTIPTGGLNVAPGSVPDANWKSVGNLNGYELNHILNYTNSLVTTEQALTAAFNYGEEVNITGADLTTTTDYTAPAGAKGLYGRGTITLGNHFRVKPFDFPTLSPFTQAASAGHSEVYLDGVDRTGQYVVIDNGYPFCIDTAADTATPVDSIDGVALTRNLNGYQSQFIQVTEIIGHTSSNKAILAQPLVVNQVVGTAKFGFPTGNLTPFKIKDGVTIKSDSNVLRRIMLLAQIKPEVVGCRFHNVHVEMRYYCYSGIFERNRITGNVAESMFSFATSSSVCSVKNNFCSTLGLNDSTIGFYRQVCYVNCVGNIVNDPLISSSYANDHWGIMFHSMVYHSIMANNVVTARAGITAQFFCDEVIIQGNTVNSFLMTSSYNNNVQYIGNNISLISDFTLQGNAKFISKANQYRIRGGATTNCMSIISGSKPFGFAGFKVINSADHELCTDDFMATVGNAFINPKTLMSDPNTASANAVFPLNNAHMANQTAGISIYDARVASLRVNSCNFNGLNYGINIYKNSSSVSRTYLDVSDTSFNTDVGVCLRGTSTTSFYTGQIRSSSFLGTYGFINANTNGYAIISSNFRSLGMSAILVASNLSYAFGVTMSTDCTVGGSVLTGFKWYDFNGYQSAYDRSVTYSKASVLPSGYWWYAPDENLGIAANIPYEYTKGATTSGGTLLRKALTVTQVV